MGNRAVITTRENFDNNGVGIYLHWNGGRDSVNAFLTYCKLRGFRTDSYGWARLCQVIGNFFGGTLSLGIDTVDHLDCDNWDNGTYLIDDWKIVGRECFDGEEQDSYDLDGMLLDIDKAQPKSEQLGEEFLKCKSWPASSLIPGDKVYVIREDNAPELFTVVGIAKDCTVLNGRDISGVPYVGRYGSNRHEYASNINNYLFEDTYRVANRGAA